MVRIRFYRRTAEGLQQWTDWLGPYSNLRVDCEFVREAESKDVIARLLLNTWEIILPGLTGSQWDGFMVQSSSWGGVHESTN